MTGYLPSLLHRFLNEGKLFIKRTSHLTGISSGTPCCWRRRPGRAACRRRGRSGARAARPGSAPPRGTDARTAGGMKIWIRKKTLEKKIPTREIYSVDNKINFFYKEKHIILGIEFIKKRVKKKQQLCSFFRKIQYQLLSIFVLVFDLETIPLN